MQGNYIEHARNTLFAYSRLRCGGDDDVRRAVEMAEVSHRGQTRDGGEDYIIHPLRVATHFVVFATQPTEEQVCAAILHDVLEDDPEMSTDRLTQGFGADVAEAVRLLSRKTPTSEMSVEAYRGGLMKAPNYVQVIKLCDRLDNVLSLTSCPDPGKVSRYLDQTVAFFTLLAQAAGRDDLLSMILDEIKRVRGQVCGL